MSARIRQIGIAALAGAWVSWLAGTFLLNRGDDVGRLPMLVAASIAGLSRGPVWGLTGLLSSVVGVIIAALIGLAWYGLGRAILSRVKATTSPGSRASVVTGLAERMLLGAAGWSTCWFFLGFLSLFRVPAAMTALVAGLALAAPGLARVRPGLGAMVRAGGWAALTLVVTGQALALIAALAPPTAKDTLLYHLALPKAWIAAGRAVEVPYNIAGYYPLGVEMHAVWAMLLGAPLGVRAAEAAAGATLFLFAPILAVVVYAWARERGASRGWAAAAALMVAWIPTVYDVAASEYVDLAMTAYTAMAMRAFGRWWVALDARHLVWIAAAVAGALSIKLSAAFLILPLALLGLLRVLGVGASPSGTRPTPVAAASIVGALAAGCAIAAPWYVRNWIRTGSPLFPFYLHLWPAQAAGWDLERSQLYDTWFSLYGNTVSPLDYVLAPLRLALTAQPDQPAYFDGVLGIAVVGVLPLLGWALWTRRLDVELRLGLLLSGCLFVFWLFSSQQLRYLLPAVPALAVSTAVAGSLLDGRLSRALRWLMLAAAAIGLPVILAWFLTLDPVRVVLGGESREDYLRRRLDYYPYYELIDRELPADAKIWLIDMRRDTYHLNRPHFSDFIFEDYTLTRYVRDASTVEDIRKRVRANGITHLLVRHDVLLDYRRSPIVDDRRSREENMAKMALMAAFFSEGTRLVKGDQKFWLIELPRRPA